MALTDRIDVETHDKHSSRWNARLLRPSSPYVSVAVHRQRHPPHTFPAHLLPCRNDSRIAKREVRLHSVAGHRVPQSRGRQAIPPGLIADRSTVTYSQLSRRHHQPEHPAHSVGMSAAVQAVVRADAIARVALRSSCDLKRSSDDSWSS